MKPIEIIREAHATELADEDGGPIELTLVPGMDATEIRSFERTLPCALPEDVRELLGVCRGVEGAIVDIEFTGAEFWWEAQQIFPHGLPIASDGFGNFWVVDLWPDSQEFGPIYFACHDPPVILYQSATLNEFLRETFRASVPAYESAVDDVHEDRLFQVWRTNPEVLQQRDLVRSSDPELRAFAEAIGKSWQVVDLRRAEVGMGFSWGRYGPETPLRRHGRAPIFAYRKPG